MKLSVIIVNWNSRKYLKKCLESLIKSIGSISYEIIVVDNNSSDDSVGYVRNKLPKVILITRKDNPGFTNGVNVGLKCCQGDNILILNPDIVVKKGALQKMITSLRKQPGVGAVGAKLMRADGKTEWPYVQFPSFAQILLFHTAIKKLTLKSQCLCRKFLWKNLDHSDREYEADLIPGGCLMLKKETVKIVGKFDPRFVLWFEDTDYCYRIKEKGLGLICVPEAEVIHLGSASTSQLTTFRYLSIFYTSMHKYFQKHKGNLYALAALLVMIMNMLVGSIIMLPSIIFPIFSREFNYKGIYDRFWLSTHWTMYLLGIGHETTLS